MCAMDPLASKTLINNIKTVKQLLKGEVVDNEQLKIIYELYGQATAEIERKEKEKEEHERKWVVFAYTRICGTTRLN